MLDAGVNTQATAVWLNCDGNPLILTAATSEYQQHDPQRYFIRGLLAVVFLTCQIVCFTVWSRTFTCIYLLILALIIQQAQQRTLFVVINCKYKV